MTQDQMRKLEKAEDILTRLYFELEEQKGCAAEAKKLDTVLGKIYKLKVSAGV